MPVQVTIFLNMHPLLQIKVLIGNVSTDFQGSLKNSLSILSKIVPGTFGPD